MRSRRDSRAISLLCSTVGVPLPTASPSAASFPPVGRFTVRPTMNATIPRKAQRQSRSCGEGEERSEKGLGLRTVFYRVGDLERAKKGYASAFGVPPYFDEPFYVGFNIGGYELGLDPDVSQGSTGKCGSL